jgi:hypothetical protein
VKDPLSFQIWIFRNYQPDCDGDRIIAVAMTSRKDWCDGDIAKIENNMKEV